MVWFLNLRGQTLAISNLCDGTCRLGFSSEMFLRCLLDMLIVKRTKL
jgi:hypothetical protein